MSQNAPGPSSAHHEWFAKWTREVQEDYLRLQREAQADPQRAGHGGESTWVRMLEEWLPPAYEVGTRKYIVPEQGDATFETDIVVFSPGYSSRLRAREEVLAGGVAAAFSVKLTLDQRGLRDAVERAALLRRGLRPRSGSPRTEMLGTFPFGLLAHSHAWKRPRSSPRRNLEDGLRELDGAHAEHPRETLDLVCVADLATVTTMRMPYLPPMALAQWAKAGLDTSRGLAISAMAMTNEDNQREPVAALITALLIRLSYSDPSLVPMADALRVTDTLGSSRGLPRPWQLSDVFSDDVCRLLPTRGLSRMGPDWGSAFW